MAQRRMFSQKIIDTDIFLEMPNSTRLLYFDLGMRADDDGFVSAPKKIMKMTGASEDDLKLLCSKQFIIPFDTGICVITHWRIHNYIQKDRYTETHYKDELSQLNIEENGKYTKCIQNGYIADTQDRIGKDRINKILSNTGRPKDINDVDDIYNSYPSKCPITNRLLGKSSQDKIKIRSLLKDKPKAEILDAIKYYIFECKKTKTYVKNFKTFLNNIPDIKDLKDREEHLRRKDEEKNDKRPIEEVILTAEERSRNSDILKKSKLGYLIK